MDIYIIETKNGTYSSIGESEHSAKINFTISFPNEKIRKIKKYDEKAFQISHLLLIDEYFED
ncbi:hypothetical protein ACQKNX_08015 [Lysinibacillus sp. NPDC093712]|uniref:hypothetical protein n=1 Tax=Lysinibacillus sp. NPDC093712 TaxID=3390579 RepID=UPI003D06ABDC